MSKTKELLEELDKKVSKLLSDNKVMQEHSDKKSLEIESLKSELQKKEAALLLSEKENAALKNHNPEENQDELKLKIGEMVKEIDRCISLLKV